MAIRIILFYAVIFINIFIALRTPDVIELSDDDQSDEVSAIMYVAHHLQISCPFKFVQKVDIEAQTCGSIAVLIEGAIYEA